MVNKFKKKKSNLVFDAEERKEYLTGFHKRKLLRKQIAVENFETLIKDERNKIKKLKKENIQKYIKTTTESAVNKINQVYEESYLSTNDYPEQHVTITSLTNYDLTNQNTLLGVNDMSIQTCDLEKKEKGLDKSNQQEIEVRKNIEKLSIILQKIKNPSKKKHRKKKKKPKKKKNK
ncbi:nucleolar protein 12-like [Gordionus sp. m RMFG-2023]|uniref:nucleolar protein 12-like n=1 Tax=Gordionus sp. m RMFG-2023 TaxID=3053472 RepID=UPI0031FD7B22